jgi:hypothetical protein
MPEHIIKFNLPEEQEELEFATKGVQYITVLQELDNVLRAKLKYEELSDEADIIYQGIRDQLHELAASRGFMIWE